MDRVLYFHADRNQHGSIRQAWEQAAARHSPLPPRSKITFEDSPNRTMAKLRSGGVDALLVDAREGSTGDAARLLEAMYGGEGADPISRKRAWLLVDPGSAGTQLAFTAGALRLAGTIADVHEDARWTRVFNQLTNTAMRSRGGKVAICLAGGGTEGLLYELGVVRALQRFLPDYPLTGVDVVCGISAGAILGALLLNGLDPITISRGLRGQDPRLDPIGRRELFDLNVRGLLGQARRLGGDMVRGRRSPLSALFHLPPAGLFEGRQLERWLQRQLERPGMVNDFGALNRDLFVGATDQDTSEHVVFGREGAPSATIHQAVRASCALAPFYAPAQLNGRFYIDGAFTRTTNTRVAVEQGATMVILIEPLVPYISARAGHVAERGAIYAAAQSLKSLINSRFAKALRALRVMFPEVAFHVFQPTGTSLRMLSGSPMKFWYRKEVEQVAFDETMRNIRKHRFDTLRRDFARHDVTFVDPDAPRDHAGQRVAIVA